MVKKGMARPAVPFLRVHTMVKIFWWIMFDAGLTKLKKNLRF